ncbi:ATP-binding protein [Streptomyces himalayensis]|uniref:ATP-binding protein n=1 Tax=Streptomyces himalayensis subsp. himalayensis TaxID=2756131 RepID=A0A7W0DV91_9ACTN|nr:ATP-binding protein [Streptomyces himalayensis]MBA2951931.1 ATP-binding protein [Streptomyces himalayensis subsp. himalayensis]
MTPTYGTCHVRQFILPTQPASVPKARHRACAALTDLGLDPNTEVTQTALLIISELVTNSVVHAGHRSPQVSITVATEPCTLILAVHDRHPQRPALPTPPDATSTGGRGLLIIADLTRQAGGSARTVPDPDEVGKTVLVRLPRGQP